MQYTLPTPYGIDYYVQLLQGRLYAFLLSQWNMADAMNGAGGDYNCFGRVYRNNTSDGYVPEFYNPATQSYVSSNGTSTLGGLYWEDSIKAMSFFGLADPMKKNTSRDDVAKVQLMYFVDLSKITAGGITNAAGQRLDEVCINDVKNFIQNNGCGFTVAETYRDVDKVLERYSGALKKNALQRDMHPKFCFRIDLELRYDPLLNTPN